MSDTPGLVDVGIRVVNSVFTWPRVVTKISSCRVNTTKQAGNQTARGFFWFYFSFIFHRKQPRPCSQQPEEIPGSCLLMTACLANGQVKCFGKFKLLQKNLNQCSSKTFFSSQLGETTFRLVHGWGWRRGGVRKLGPLFLYLVVSRRLIPTLLCLEFCCHLCPHTSSVIHDTVELHTLHLVYILAEKHPAGEGLMQVCPRL